MSQDYEDDPTLADPDESTEIKYSWDEEFQRHIIALLLSDRQFLLQSMDLVKATYFTNKAHQKACSVLFKFFEDYKILPHKDFITQEIKNDLKDNKSLAYYLGELNVVYDYFQPGLDAREYLQDKISYFAKIQSVKRAFENSLKEIGKNPESQDTWEKVYDMMREAMTTHHNFEIGLDYFKSLKDRYEKEAEEEEHETFITGHQTIDLDVSYRRGEMIAVVAGSGVGKSVWLACLSRNNLLKGKKGVYITLELAEEKVADRMDALLTGLPIQSLCDHKEEVFEKLENLKGVDYESGMPFVIKQFPAGRATVNIIRTYLSQLRFHGFNPDFVIVDYVGEMQDMPGMKTYESREKTIRELRGMASEENVFVATAMQPNRGSKEAQNNESGKLDEEHLADSFGQIRPLDACYSIMQNDGEKKLGLGRFYVMKQRDGQSRYWIYLKFDKESLMIYEIDKSTYIESMNAQKEYVSEEVMIDKTTSVNQWPGEDTNDDVGMGDEENADKTLSD